MDRLLIGIIESEQQIEDQSSDWNSFTINKIGGYPVLSPNTSKDVINCFKSLVCDLCKQSLAFVLQIYCPIDDSTTDRVIYLFICMNSECTQCTHKWFAIRSVTPFVTKINEKTEINPLNDIWIEGQTDWQIEDNDNQSLETIKEDIPYDKSLSKLCVDCNNSPSIGCEAMAYFQPFYVTVVEEPSEMTNDDTNDKHINNLIESYERNNGQQISAENTTENYESNDLQTIYRNDRKNYEFFKKLSICSKQIIRYQWTGQPLINSDIHNPIVSKCNYCGANLCFEFQLMPALISYLKCLPNVSKIERNIDFGTVLIFSCNTNCVQTNDVIIEQTIVLSEPENLLINKIKE